MFSTSPEQATLSAKLSRYRDTFSPSTFCLELEQKKVVVFVLRRLKHLLNPYDLRFNVIRHVYW